MDKSIIDEELDIPFDDVQLENGFINVLNKPTNMYFQEMHLSFGADRCISNGHMPRTKHEVYSGFKKVEQKNIIIDTEIVNLPFTVVNGRGKPAETAFTTRDNRKIYLVPDHTPTRILNDLAHHREGFEMLLAQSAIDKGIYDTWDREMKRLDVGERTAASIIHEFGHILTYRAMDNNGIEQLMDVYDWLDDSGYLDNCASRIVSFSDRDPFWKINVAIEQIAEDYRVSFDIRESYGMSSLPHCITYVQDIIKPDNFLRGVEIMTNLLQLGKAKKKINEIKANPLDIVLPFGEASRSSFTSRFTQGDPTPLTDKDKDKDRELIRKYENSL
ncbi:hypothetical protein [Peribacillus sp. AS_2]|uniref:hypothetical protein n=1 Tax=Peribacillus sp. AS_2 TaxID=2996755 RepID=UPI0022A68C28|nr:hypothetical protein [Peribacillus sp. AS_2]MCZ0870919.1 hypothetical protein [Peribacillus sp. AS_2]